MTRKMVLTLVFAVVSAMVLTACGSTTKVRVSTDPGFFENKAELIYEIGEVEARSCKAPGHFLFAVHEYLEAELRSRDMMASEEGGGVYRVEVSVYKYRMRSGFSRQTFGILAGKDGLTSLVRIFSIDTGELIGESKVMTYNLTDAMNQDDVARWHAAEIGRYLAGEE